MRIRFNLRYLLISALLFSLQLSRAQTNLPPGSVVTFNFGETEGTQLWDLSGSYNLSFTVSKQSGLAIPVTVSFKMTQDAAGNLHGVTGDFQLLAIGSNDLFTVSYSIVGKVTGSGGAARARFTVHMVGNGTSAGIFLNSMSAFIVVDASPNLGDGQLEGIARFSSNLSTREVSGLGNVSGNITDFATPLPANVDGTWVLLLQPSTFNNSVGGLAAVATSTGHSFGFFLTGPFRNEVFKTTLRGAGNFENVTMSGIGSNAKGLFDPSFNLLQFSGRLMGQKIFISGD